MTPITELFWTGGMHDRFRKIEADVARLRALRELMGHVEDGSGTMVTLCQDDATGDFLISAGDHEYCGKSFSEVLDQLFREHEATN